MMRTILVPAALAALLALATASQVHAYGACSRSATYRNPYTGRSATVNEGTAVGPNGVYHGASVSGSGPNGSYEAAGARAYSPSTYGGYTAVGHTSYYGNGDVVHSTTNP
jgi:hypothetical protein